MSQNIIPLQPILVQDPITEVVDVTKYAVLESGNQITWKNYTSSSVSNSSVQFTCTPPSGSTIIDRNALLSMPVRLTLTGLVKTTDLAFVPPTSLIHSEKDCPTAFPLSSSMDTLLAKINGTSFSIPMADVINPLLHFNTSSELRNKEYSMTPTMNDSSFNFNDLYGTNRNPQGCYGNSIKGSELPRGAFPFTIISNAPVIPSILGTPATAVIDFFVTEPLFLSPFYFGCADDNAQGFYNVSGMDFNLTFLSQAAAAMWSHNPNASSSGIINVTTEITAGQHQFQGFATPFSYQNQLLCQMFFKNITPNPLAPQRIGPNIPVTYPYFEVNRYSQEIGMIASASSGTTQQTQNLQLNTIPRRVLVFARPSNSAAQSRFDLTKTYLAIKSVSVQWANSPTVLSGASQQQLYQIAVKNGCDLSWSEWTGLGVYNSAFPTDALSKKYGGVGSLLMLELGTDINLQPNEAPGISGYFNLQMSVTLENMNKSGEWDNVPMALYIIAISEGTTTIGGIGSMFSQLGVLTKNDVLDAQSQPGINYRQLQTMSGGNFLTTLGNIGSKINEFMSKTKLLSTLSALAMNIPDARVKGVATGVNAFANTIGWGEGGVAISNSKRGGAVLKKNKISGRL